MTPKQTISLAEGARRARVHQRTLRRWIDDGIIAGYYVGPRVLRVDPAEIDSILTPVAAK